MMLLEPFPELDQVKRVYPQFFHKTDRWGRPVWIELLGHIDVDKLLSVSVGPHGRGGGRLRTGHCQHSGVLAHSSSSSSRHNRRATGRVSCIKVSIVPSITVLQLHLLVRRIFCPVHAARPLPPGHHPGALPALPHPVQ
jgi:hypothetical protein